MERKKNSIKEEILEKAIDILSSNMPRNTNWHSYAARKIAAQLVIEMIFVDYKIKKKKRKDT